MTISRRGFLGAILAAAAAPAIVKSDSLMRIMVPRPVLLTLWGDGVHDDAQALQALISGQSVAFQGRAFGPRPDGTIYLPVGTFAMGAAAIVGPGSKLFGNGSTLKALHDGPMLDIKNDDTGVQISGFHFIGRGNPGIKVKP